MAMYEHPAHLGGFVVSRCLGRTPCTDRIQISLNEQVTFRWYQWSSSAWGVSAEICSSSLLTTAAGGVRVSGVTLVNFTSFGMVIGMFLSRDIGFKMVLCPCLGTDNSSPF